MRFNLDFTDKTVLVTGSTRGIGKQIYNDFKDLGAKVIGVGSKDYNLADEKSLAAFLEVLEQYDKIDVCINNAGIIYSEPIVNFSVDRYKKLMDINLKAPFLITSLVSRKMIANSWGRIVNISSIAANRVRAGRSAYSAAKHGLNGFTKTIAAELAPFNILVNTVSPGFTMTEMTESMLPIEEIELLKKQVPVGRFATTEDISNAVVFLASPLNTFITGHDLIVDGGFINVVSV